MKNKLSNMGFTLAEVLITLGIIGIVAALTIPELINNYKAERYRTKFLKTYSTLQQVFKQMQSDDVSLDPASYPYSRPFYRTFKNYITGGVVDCGRLDGQNIRTSPCYYVRAKKYKDMSGKKNFPDSILDDGQLVLPDGTILFFENGSTIYITADLNGLDLPNRSGIDLFTFQFIEDELRTMGSFGTRYNEIDKYCNYSVTNNSISGIACAHLAKSDSSYFKKAIKYK